MSRALDNDNPTIFAPTAPTTSRRRPQSTKAMLWSDDATDFRDFAIDADHPGSGEDEREEIDAEEVFGESFFKLQAVYR